MCRRRETEDEVQMLQRLLLLRDVAAGMEFLHSKNIVHSDLVSPGRLAGLWLGCTQLTLHT